MVTVAAAVTRAVEIRNRPLVCPTRSRTGEGNGSAAGLLLESVIDAPPGGAGPVSVNVRIVLLPPVTVAVARLIDANVGRTTGVTVAVAVLLVELYVAVTVTGVEAVTALVCTETAALDR